MTLGKTMHSTLGKNYRQKINSRNDLNLEHLHDYFSKEWENSLVSTEFLRDEEPGKMKDDGYRLLEKYHSEIAGYIQPTSVEQGFLISLEGVDLPLMGYIDLIDEDGKVIDHKVSKKSMNENITHKDPQMTAYSLAYRNLASKKEAGLRFDVMIRTKEPKIQQVETKRDENDYKRFSKLLSKVNNAINSGIFYPNESYLCSVCCYKRICNDW